MLKNIKNIFPLVSILNNLLGITNCIDIPDVTTAHGIHKFKSSAYYIDIYMAYTLVSY